MPRKNTTAGSKDTSINRASSVNAFSALMCDNDDTCNDNTNVQASKAETSRPVSKSKSKSRSRSNSPISKKPRSNNSHNNNSKTSHPNNNNSKTIHPDNNISDDDGFMTVTSKKTKKKVNNDSDDENWSTIGKRGKTSNARKDNTHNTDHHYERSDRGRSLNKNGDQNNDYSEKIQNRKKIKDITESHYSTKTKTDNVNNVDNDKHDMTHSEQGETHEHDEKKGNENVYQSRYGRYNKNKSNSSYQSQTQTQTQTQKNDYREYADAQYYDPEVIDDAKTSNDLSLNTPWKVWIHANNTDKWGLDSYDSGPKIDSIGQMMRCMYDFESLNKRDFQYFVMRNEIAPIWEDINNKDGVITSIKINLGNRDDAYDIGAVAFKVICILVLNESFVKNNTDINGVCFQLKNNSPLIKIWVKDRKRNATFEKGLPMALLRNFENMVESNRKYGSNYYRGGARPVSVLTRNIKPDE